MGVQGNAEPWKQEWNANQHGQVDMTQAVSGPGGQDNMHPRRLMELEFPNQGYQGDYEHTNGWENESGYSSDRGTRARERETRDRSPRRRNDWKRDSSRSGRDRDRNNWDRDKEKDRSREGDRDRDRDRTADRDRNKESSPAYRR